MNNSAESTLIFFIVYLLLTPCVSSRGISSYGASRPSYSCNNCRLDITKNDNVKFCEFFFFYYWIPQKDRIDFEVSQSLGAWFYSSNSLLLFIATEYRHVQCTEIYSFYQVIATILTDFCVSAYNLQIAEYQRSAKKTNVT